MGEERRERLDALAELGEYATSLRRAPVGIVFLVHKRGEEIAHLDVLDCGRAFRNLKLTATSTGIGTVPQAVDSEQADELLEVPDDTTVLIALAVEHPADPDDTIESISLLIKLGENASGNDYSSSGNRGDTKQEVPIYVGM